MVVKVFSALLALHFFLVCFVEALLIMIFRVLRRLAGQNTSWFCPDHRAPKTSTSKRSSDNRSNGQASKSETFTYEDLDPSTEQLMSCMKWNFEDDHFMGKFKALYVQVLENKVTSYKKCHLVLGANYLYLYIDSDNPKLEKRGIQRGRLLIRMAHQGFCKATVKKKYPQLIMLFYDDSPRDDEETDMKKMSDEGHQEHQNGGVNPRVIDSVHRHINNPSSPSGRPEHLDERSFVDNPIVLLFDNPRPFIQAFEEVALKTQTSAQDP